MVMMIEEKTNLADDVSMLEDTRDELQNLISQAISEREEAKLKLKITGQYSDPEWFSNINEIIRDKTTELHIINRKIKSIRSQLSKSNPKASFFQEAAKSILDEETYNSVNLLANEMMKGN